MFASYCILKIILLFLLDSFSSGDLVYNQKNTRIFVEKGGDVILNCTCGLLNESSWTGPKISAIAKIDKNAEETYVVGLMINPKLHDLNVEIIGNNNTDDCSLVVTNFSEVGVGLYICEYWKSGIVYIHNFAVNLKSRRTTSQSVDSSMDSHITSTLLVTSSTSFKVNNTTTNLDDHLSDDDFKSTYVYGYCWILMGSIAAGIALLCGCSHIFCYIKCAKTIRKILHINPDDNYDVVETLNYNNAIFDHTANNEELNNDNVSSSIDSNDIILRDGVVSSNDSSSIKLSVDGYENPYQTINSCDIEMHHYSSIVSSNYQNTIIFPPSLSKNTSKHLNISKDSLINPWLVIYKRKQ